MARDEWALRRGRAGSLGRRAHVSIIGLVSGSVANWQSFMPVHQPLGPWIATKLACRLCSIIHTV